MNYKFLPEIAKFISREFRGIDRVVFINMKYTGNAWVNRKKLFVRVSDVAEYAERAVDILNRENIEVRLFHFPLCILKSNYRRYAEGVTKQLYELTFVPQCRECKLKEKCPRIWRSYVKIAGGEEFTPIS